MALPDLTDEAPVRRMSVARGRLSGAQAPDAAQQAAARAAAALAVKQASLVLPTLPPFQATHVDVEFHDEDEVACTVTVQAWARAHLDTAALLGLCAALLAVRDAAGAQHARIVDAHLVQNVG